MQPETVVRKAYQAILGRSPDALGLAFYAKSLADGTLTADALAQSLISSDEFRSRPDRSAGEARPVVNALVKFHTDFTVQDGPFSGMKLLDLSNRGDGDVSPKLLGTYEREIHPALREFSGNAYDAIIDIGCAEGYFAVGMARLFPGTPVLAYDTDKGALDILRETADINGCLDRITGGDFCDPPELGRVLTKYPRSIVIVDCEGYEKALFSVPETNRLAASADFIIECHDLYDDTITPSICQALGDSHDIEVVYATGRNPNVYDFLSHLPDWDRFRAVWERRGARQNWLVCRSKAFARQPAGETTAAMLEASPS